MAGAPLAGLSPVPDPTPRIVVADVVTMDPDRPRAEAFAVQGEHLLAVGTLAEVRAAAPGAAEEVLAGTVLPGLIDAHMHMERGGLKALDQVGTGLSLDEFMAAMQALGHHSPDWSPAEPPTLDQRVEAIELLQAYLHQLGFTGIVDPASTIEEMRGYQEARRRGALGIRVVAMPYPQLGSARVPDVEAAIAHLEAFGASTGFGDEWLRLGPIKFYHDGEGMKGQALLERPWNELACGHGGEPAYHGEQRSTDAEVERLLTWCAGHGWGAGIHAVGGGAIAKVIDLLADLDEKASIEDLRFQVIHAYLETSPESIRKAAEHHVIASLQPSIVWNNGAGLRRLLGERADTANPVRSWLDAGAVVAFGSDGPWFVFDPRHNVWQAVTRFVKDDPEPLSAAEAITAEEGFAAYTRGAAWAAMAEHTRGRLKPGMLADWALWDRDPTRVPVEELRSAKVLRTDVGGRTVFQA